MRWFKLILFLVCLALISSVGFGQGVTNFGATRPQDTGKTKGQLVFTAYANSNASKFLTVDANGKVVFAVPSGGGSTDSSVFTTIYRDDTGKTNIRNAKQDNITLTTTGSSGAATLTGATLNIPVYSASSSGIQTVTATAPLTGGGSTATVTVGIQQASPLQAGYVTATDYRRWDSLRAGGSTGSVLFNRGGVQAGNDSLVYMNDGSFYAPSLHSAVAGRPDLEINGPDSIIKYSDGTYFYNLQFPVLPDNQIIFFPISNNFDDTLATKSYVRADYVPYTGATDSVSLGENQIRAGQFALDLTPTSPQVTGGIYWDVTDVCPSVPLDADVTMQIGQEMYMRARNNTGSTIPNGHAVYINGAQGNNPTIALADADSIDLSKVIGVATEDIPDNSTGFVTTEGVVRSVNTSAWTAGDALFLDTVAGDITNNVASYAKGIVFIGFALNSTNNGKIYVKPSVPISGDTTLTGNTMQVAPTQTAVRKYVQAFGYGTGTIRALSGDVTASGSGTVTATLATVNATPATYGAAGEIPVITVDSKGRTTTVTTVSPAVTLTNTVTLTNKRWTPRVKGAASYTTSVTIPADSTDMFEITAQAGALLFNAPSGTPNNGDILEIKIKDNGTARALTWNAIFNWNPPSTTVLGKWMYILFQYNATTSNWNFMHKRDEP